MIQKKELIKHLTDWWKGAELPIFKASFEVAMKKMKIPKKDKRYKEQGKCYCVYDDGGRITCSIYNTNKNSGYGNEIFEIVLRKKAGNYVIISHNQNRVFEIDYIGLRNEEGSLIECYNEYKQLFEIVFNYKV